MSNRLINEMILRKTDTLKGTINRTKERITSLEEEKAFEVLKLKEAERDLLELEEFYKTINKEEI